MVTVNEALQQLSNVDVSTPNINTKSASQNFEEALAIQGAKEDTLNKSALPGLADRVQWGFADDWGKKQILSKYYQPQDIVNLGAGNFGVKTQFGIQPVDPKGLQSTDLAGDIGESLGKVVTYTGGVLGGILGGAAGGVGAGAGYVTGTAAGEAARQYIGTSIGVRDPQQLAKLVYRNEIGDIKLGGAGEILGEAALSYAGNKAGDFLGDIISKKFVPSSVGTKTGNTLSDMLQNKTSAQALSVMDDTQKAALKSLPVEDIKAAKFAPDEKLFSKAANLESTTGVPADVWESFVKGVRQGKDLPLNPTAARKTEDEFAKHVLDIRDSADKIHSYLSSQYKQAINNVNLERKVADPNLKQAIQNAIDEAPELKNILSKSNLLTQKGSVKSNLTYKELLDAKRRINETGIMKQHWAAEAAGKPEMVTTQGYNLKNIDGKIRELLNQDTNISQVNQMYGEAMDSIKRVKSLMTDRRGERLLARLREEKGIKNFLVNPLQEFEAVILKHGEAAGVKPIYDNVMDTVVKAELGSMKKKGLQGLAETTFEKGLGGLKFIPGVGAAVDVLTTPKMMGEIVRKQIKAGIKVNELLGKGIQNNLVKGVKNIVKNKTVRNVASTTAKFVGQQSLNSILYRNK